MDSSFPDNLIDIKEYNFFLADHLDNIQRDGVCIYYKVSLPVQIKALPYFKKALFLQIIHSSKKIIVSVIYRSPSPNNCELVSFLTNFNHLLSKISKCKPSLAVIRGDVNARSPAW